MIRELGLAQRRVVKEARPDPRQASAARLIVEPLAVGRDLQLVRVDDDRMAGLDAVKVFDTSSFELMATIPVGAPRLEYGRPATEAGSTSGWKVMERSPSSTRRP
jgi:hypothetical protein